MKDIVIIANFVSSLQGTDNDRIPYLANMLSKNNSVELVASTYCHEDKVRRTSICNFPFKVTLLEEPGYKKNICLKRFWSHYIWGRNVLKYIKNRKKPDCIYCTIPSLTAASLVSEYCNNNGIRFIIDVQDLWPEAFQMVFNIPVISKIIFAPFKYLANKAYRNADEVIAVSQTYVNRALSVNKKGAKGLSIFLGTNLDTFDECVRKNFAKIQKEYSKKDEIWIGYCGTLGKSYDLPTVFDALYLLKSQNKIVPKLIVMGDGPNRAEFESYAESKQANVLFTGKIPYENMCALLSICDIAINPIIGLSVASIINKHADYAAAGIPVINTQNSQEYRNLVESYKMGLNCKNGDAIELAQTIEHLSILTDLRKQMGACARKCAEEKFDRKATYSLVSRVIGDM